MSIKPLAIVVLAFLPTVVLAAEPGPALPSDLALVPRDAAGFFHIRAAELWKTDMVADLRHILKHAGPQALAAFEKQCPIPPDSIDRITFIMMTPRAMAEPFPDVDPEAVSALWVIHTAKPFARLAVMRSLGQREKSYRRQLYHFNEELWSGLYFVDEQTFIIGSEDALLQYLDSPAESRRTGPLGPALAIAAGKHHLVLGVNPVRVAKEIPGVPGPMQPLFEANCATITMDFDKATQADLHLDFATEEKAKAGEKGVRNTLEMLRGLMSFPIGELEGKLIKDPKEAKPGIGDLPESFGMLLGIGFMRELDTMMKDAVVEQKGTSVHMPAKFSRLYSGNSSAMMVMWVAALGVRAGAYFDSVGDRIGGKDPNEEHMRKLADAMERYRQDKGTYPSAAVYDKDGRPILSWRVALLPYLEEEALYKEFHLDEPWDSLHNKKLIKKLPKALTTQRPWRSRKGKTSDLVFTGANTAFEGKKGIRKDDVAPKTILVIQASGSHGVYWTKPADLAYRAGGPLPELFEKYGGQVRIITADGTYRTFQKGADDKTLQDMIPRKQKAEPKSEK